MHQLPSDSHKMIRFFFLLAFASLTAVSGSMPRPKAYLFDVSSRLPKKLAPVGTVISTVLPLKARLKAKEFLVAHNAVRVKLGHPPLRWDNGLARYARRFADTRVADCKMIHSNGMYGKNIFWGRSSLWSPEKIVGVWLEEQNYYDASTNTCMPGEICGHFTQVVWRDTLRCGCARVNCTGGAGVYAICVYDPPGNYIGESPFQHYTEE